jgi:hypothetical protein
MYKVWLGIIILRGTSTTPRGTSQEYNHGEDIDRDYNASLNILERGLQKVGLGLPELTPADIRPLQRLYRVSASQMVETGSPSLDKKVSPRELF